MIQQIILADDREIYRIGVVELFSHHNQFQIVAEVDGRKALQDALIANHSAVVITSAPFLPELEPADIRLGLTGCRILLVIEDSDHPDRYRSGAALEIIQRSASPASLMEALRRICVCGTAGWRKSNNDAGGFEGARASTCLTAHEIALVGLLMRGFKNRRIAERLGVPEQAVRSRFQKIFDKTGQSSRLELAMFVSDHPLLAAAASANLACGVLWGK